MSGTADLNWYSMVVVQLEQLCGERGNSMAHSTAFFVTWRGFKFLVTNHHVVSGFTPGTRKIIHSSGALPGTLKATLGIPLEQWRVLDNAHKKRNNAEYEGVFDVSEDLVHSVIKVTITMLSLLES